jgi:hypothetical protein
MTLCKLTSILILGCLILSADKANAQQPAGAKKAPRLTSDDVVRSRANGTVVVLNAIDPNKWTKYTPGGLRLSLELPAGIEPHEVDFLEHAPNAPHAQYVDAKLYLGTSTSLQVNLLYIPSEKLNVGEVELKKAALAFVKAFSTKMDPKARYSTQLTNKSTVSVKGSMTGAGGEAFELMGSMQTKGMEMWFVGSIFRQSDERARIAARRITNTATLN